jgi:F420-dependent oxidoreductase-like protein
MVAIMQFGIDLAQQRMTWDELLNRVHFAEQAGFDGAWGFDHFQPLYGEGPGNCFEGMTTLGALASQTTRIRLGLLVTGITYRHPSVLTAQAITVDHISHGRFDLGIGAAWFQPEHVALGIDFPTLTERFDRLEECLEVVTRLMTGEPATFHGKHFNLSEAQMLPTPVQTPHPPIWVGGSGRSRTLPIAARWADAWHTFGDPEGYQKLSVELDRLAEAQGRDPSSILRASSLSLSEPWDDVRATIEGFEKAGVTYLVCWWPTEGYERLDYFVEHIMAPHVD